MPSPEKLIRLHQSLMKLSQSRGFIQYPRLSKLKRYTQTCAEQLGVARVSIWKLNESQTAIDCEVMYNRESEEFASGAVLEQETFPAYFQAMYEDRLINADDALNDPRTNEFSESYLAPNGITSMLDAPIFSAGKLNGVICLEHIGPARVWDMAEMSFVASLADNVSMINEQEAWLQDREKLEFLEHYDSLTGLERRNYFQRRMDHDLHGTSDQSRTRALALVSLDFFGGINDRYGHAAADSLLATLAEQFQEAAHKFNCRLARVGGDIFGFWISNLLSSEQLEGLLKTLEQIGSESIQVENGTRISISFSTGVVIYPICGEDLSSPMRCAELALQKAKEQARGNVEYFSLEWLDQIRRKQREESDLIEAVRNEQLCAYYQPIYSASDDSCAGIEALVRWHHPERGLISPADFLPLAKKLGLMNKIGSFMIKQACKDIKALRAMGKNLKWVAVNLASEQLYCSSLASEIGDILHECDLPADTLQLEIVEELISQDSTLVRNQLEALSSLGLKLAIDDFGTGYSSLSRLKSMPVNKLKIDKSFVDGLPDSEDDCCITQSIIGLARGMKIELVAEGIETLAQADYLKDANCTYLQGYYYARPMPLPELVKKL